MLIHRECHKLKLLQKFGFQKSSYERPTQKWVCGHLSAGKPCPVGPSRRGVCEATFECQPHKSDSRWECTRPASRGGVCEQGPLPDGECCKAITKCKPDLSLRAKRGRTVRWVSALAVGFIVLLVSLGSDMRLLMPGPLNSVHSSLQSCQNCHASTPDGNFAWMQTIFASADVAKDSAACIDCHKVGTEALKPHSLAQEKMDPITRAHQAVSPKQPLPIVASFRNAMFPVEKTFEQGVNCATCHKEHQGDKSDLTAMSDVQCQVCHVKQFTSFQDGHPEFTQYPFARRTRTIFDHAKHFSTHFPKAVADGQLASAQPGVCADCHVTDGNLGLTIVKPYEQMCAACHTRQIVGTDRASGPKGITLLALPGLDLEVLREKNADIGEWPEDSEAEIPALMKLLIGWDDERRKMLDAVENLDLLDLTDATDADITMIESFVWEVKSLIYQLGTLKPTDAMKMLSPEMGGSIDAKLLASLTANMPRDVMLGVARDWLPNLPMEVLRRKRGERLMPAEPVAVEDPAEEKAETGKSETPPEESAEGAGDDILSGGDDILAEEKGDDILSGGDDILAEEKGDDILSGGEDILAEEKGDDILSGGEDILAEEKSDDILSGEADTAEEVKAAEVQDKPEKMPEPMEAEAWAEFGGWYRQDFAVLYKPVGHKDSFMKAWLDYSGAQYGNDKARLAAPIFDAMTDKQAQGQCAKCHSIDAGAGDSRKVNWKPFSVEKPIGKFTKFAHEPHFGLFGDKGCVACHVIDSEAKYLDTYKSLDPKVFASNFKPVGQQTCAACHQKSAAGESCLLCHIYHVEDVNTPMMTTRLPK